MNKKYHLCSTLTIVGILSMVIHFLIPLELIGSIAVLTGVATLILGIGTFGIAFLTEEDYTISQKSNGDKT